MGHPKSGCGRYRPPRESTDQGPAAARYENSPYVLLQSSIYHMAHFQRCDEHAVSGLEERSSAPAPEWPNPNSHLFLQGFRSAFCKVYLSCNLFDTQRSGSSWTTNRGYRGSRPGTSQQATMENRGGFKGSAQPPATKSMRATSHRASGADLQRNSTSNTSMPQNQGGSRISKKCTPSSSISNSAGPKLLPLPSSKLNIPTSNPFAKKKEHKT